jgi:hypothetical protein
LVKHSPQGKKIGKFVPFASLGVAGWQPCCRVTCDFAIEHTPSSLAPRKYILMPENYILVE